MQLMRLTSPRRQAADRGLGDAFNEVAAHKTVGHIFAEALGTAHPETLAAVARHGDCFGWWCVRVWCCGVGCELLAP